MRVVVQRVLSARVEVEREVVGAIDRGLLAYMGFGRDDTTDDRRWMVSKIAGLRVFEDPAGGAATNDKMTLSVDRTGPCTG
jgi:D-tyrosyl-tRNA(Tyr) deacylase